MAEDAGSFRVVRPRALSLDALRAWQVYALSKRTLIAQLNGGAAEYRYREGRPQRGGGGVGGDAGRLAEPFED
ncbi:hypothetical protein B9Q03_10990 [Candidatus Marsarchaeota G2 archaeon OSP_D]|jgi:hypothetical protein|uniref:Uncharacterized protein n=1 Tax=Candidatus Marsarchaeota G2 archaeon OSP_D TaxID=1978157 RepID=A0A2R6ALH0_9ARCH|nr:MAG: hypothetical protein B9Q03_10990 [Candidatus Marsarchaeota G2 archaeon OSP_D]